MKSESITRAIPNSLLLIMDSRTNDIPSSLYRGIVASTRSCIALSCLPDFDGQTEIRIGPASEIRAADVLVFEGPLHTPSRRLIVAVVPDVPVIAIDVPTGDTHLQVWTNGLRDTDIVAIGIA